MGEKKLREFLQQFCKDVDTGRRRTEMHNRRLQRWLLPPLVGATLGMGVPACDDESEPEPTYDYQISDYVAVGPFDTGHDTYDMQISDYVAPWPDDLVDDGDVDSDAPDLDQDLVDSSDQDLVDSDIPGDQDLVDPDAPDLTDASETSTVAE